MRPRFAGFCPIYRSIESSIDITTELEIVLIEGR